MKEKNKKVLNAGINAFQNWMKVLSYFGDCFCRAKKVNKRRHVATLTFGFKQ